MSANSGIGARKAPRQDRKGLKQILSLPKVYSICFRLNLFKKIVLKMSMQIQDICLLITVCNGNRILAAQIRTEDNRSHTDMQYYSDTLLEVSLTSAWQACKLPREGCSNNCFLLKQNLPNPNPSNPVDIICIIYTPVC